MDEGGVRSGGDDAIGPRFPVLVAGPIDDHVLVLRGGRGQVGGGFPPRIRRRPQLDRALRLPVAQLGTVADHDHRRSRGHAGFQQTEGDASGLVGAGGVAAGHGSGEQGAGAGATGGVGVAPTVNDIDRTVGQRSPTSRIVLARQHDDRAGGIGFVRRVGDQRVTVGAPRTGGDRPRPPVAGVPLQRDDTVVHDDGHALANDGGVVDVEVGCHRRRR